MSMTCAPLSTCWRATASASSKRPSRIIRAKASSRSVGALADVYEQAVGTDVEGSRPTAQHLLTRHGPGRNVGNRWQSRRCVPASCAAAADDVDEAGLGPPRIAAASASGVRRRPVGTAGSAGRRWVCGDVRVADVRQVFDVLTQFLRASAQFRPTRSAAACASEFQKASAVWGQGAADASDRGRRPSRNPPPISPKSFSIANTAAFALSVSKIVSISSRSAPPSSNPRAESWSSSTSASNVMFAEAGVVHVRRDRQRARGRSSTPAQKAAACRGSSRCIRRTAHAPGGRLRR